MSDIPWVHITSNVKGFWPNFFGALGCMIIVPIFLLILPFWWLVRKMLGLPLSYPTERSAAEVADILRNYLYGDKIDFPVWDEFTCVSIADPALDSIRMRASVAEIRDSDERAAIICELLAECEAMVAAGVENAELPCSSQLP